MNNIQRSFSYHVQDMMRKGYRAYFIENMREFQEDAYELAEEKGLEIEVCDPFRIVFIKDDKKKIWQE